MISTAVHNLGTLAHNVVPVIVYELTECNNNMTECFTSFHKQNRTRCVKVD